MDALILAGCLGLIIYVPTLPDPVDVVEVNHVLDANGEETLVQLIFWDMDREGEERIVAWVLHKDPGHNPRRDWRTGRYVVRLLDHGNIRVITAQAFIETWTDYDPELTMRGVRPQEQRAGLTKTAP